MNVVFVAPNFPHNQREFVRALAMIGARVYAIGETPHAFLDDQLRGWLSGYYKVDSFGNEEQMTRATRYFQSICWVDRMEATIESHMLVTARVREACSIPGTSYETTLLCRDKFLMKQHLRKHGIPCAWNALVKQPKDAHEFVEEHGFPVILKPLDGAGTHDTHRVDNKAQLAAVLEEMGIGSSPRRVAIEEYITGHEGFFDTLVSQGHIAFYAVCHYYPNVLEAMRTRWISPQIVTTNRVDSSGYDELKVMGKKVIDALGIHTAPTHMEWFYGPKGLKFSEIGCRPPGCKMWNVYCWANEMDLYIDWALAIVGGPCFPRPSRRFSAGLISIRPERDGHIQGYSGIDDVRAALGDALGECYFPPAGQRTAPVEAGYLGHAYLHARAQDYDDCRRMLDFIGRTVHCHAG